MAPTVLNVSFRWKGMAGNVVGEILYRKEPKRQYRLFGIISFELYYFELWMLAALGQHPVSRAGVKIPCNQFGSYVPVGYPGNMPSSVVICSIPCAPPASIPEAGGCAYADFLYESMRD